MKVNRVFSAIDRNGNLTEFELVVPNIAAENEGERQYRVAFSKALTEGVFPREKLREIMREHNMWTDEDDRQLKVTVGKIALLQVQLHQFEAEGNGAECKRVAKEIASTRRRMWELFMVQQTVYMNSAEGVAEMVKTDAIMAFCTQVKATGERYWKNYAEYVRERDLNTKSTVYSHIVQIQSKVLDQIRNNLEEDYPEYQYVKGVEDRVIDREIEEEVAKTLKMRAEKAIEDNKQATKKKTTRRKKVGRKVASKNTNAK